MSQPYQDKELLWELLKAAESTVEEFDERIKLKQLPIATRMLLLNLNAVIRHVRRECEMRRV